MACAIHPDRDSVAVCVTCGNELCAECRTVVGGRNYCPTCAPQAAAAPPSEPAAAPAAPATTAGNEVLAALCYPIWIVALIVIVTDMKKDAYMRTHGWQGLFWGIAWVVIMIAVAIVMVPVGIAGLGALGGLLYGVAWVAWLVLSILYAIKAYNRQPVVIPIITDMAAKQYTKPV
jgi:uncharacterized membrane protein